MSVTGRRIISPAQQAVYARHQRAQRLQALYERRLMEEGLDPGTALDEFIGHCIAKGANNLLTFQCRDERKLAYDPDAALLPALKERLERGDYCIRNHPPKG